MDIRLLKYFVTVCEEGSITKAARKLNMSQPPLSKQMKQLEEEMGVLLFIRGKKNIQLTQAGIFLQNRATELISSMELVQRQMSDYSTGSKGRIIIGAVEAVAANYLPPLLQAFHQDYPQVTYEIWSGSTDDILRKLDKGTLDVALIRPPFDYTKYHHFTLLEDSWGALFPIGSPLAEEPDTPVTGSVLSPYPLIIPSTKGRMEELDTWFENSGHKPNVLCSYNVLAIGEALVKENMGVALVLTRYTTHTVPPNLCYKKLSPPLDSSVHVLWSRTHFLSEPASRMVDFFQRQAQDDHTQKI